VVAVPAIARPPFKDVEGAAAKRDPSADERLRGMVLEHYDFVWRSLRRLGVAPPETDDAAQQVFMVLARKLANVEAGKERTFIFGIVMRVAANVRRARANLREVPEEEAPHAQFVLPAVEARLDRADARAALDEILASMPDERRAVFILSVLEEQSVSEISATLQIPVSTVMSRLRRAREDLRAGIARLRARRKGV
jgi:RNA polymerase sigma-70 factor, ECF subfamily